MTSTEKSPNTVVGRVVIKPGTVPRKNTRTVEVRFSRRHPRYQKVVQQRTKLQMHDPEEQTKNGDLVEIIESRPISKTKCWVLNRVIESASA